MFTSILTKKKSIVAPKDDTDFFNIGKAKPNMSRPSVGNKSLIRSSTDVNESYVFGKGSKSAKSQSAMSSDSDSSISSEESIDSLSEKYEES